MWAAKQGEIKTAHECRRSYGRETEDEVEHWVVVLFRKRRGTSEVSKASSWGPEKREDSQTAPVSQSAARR